MIVLDKVEHDGRTIEIWQDEDAENPREWEPEERLLIKTSTQRNLSNVKEGDFPNTDDFDSWEGFDEAMKALPGDPFWFPVTAHIHGTVSFSLTSSGGCRFDSGRVGVVLLAQEDAQKIFPGLSGQELLDKVRALLAARLDVYASWINGEVYGYSIQPSPDGEHCGGFYSTTEAIEEAKKIVESLNETQADWLDRRIVARDEVLRVLDFFTAEGHGSVADPMASQLKVDPAITRREALLWSRVLFGCRPDLSAERFGKFQDDMAGTAAFTNETFYGDELLDALKVMTEDDPTLGDP